MNTVSIIEAIATNGKANQLHSVNDYIDDAGLLCCGVCHERKEYIPSEWIFHGQKLPIKCKCDIQREQMEAEQKHKERVRYRKEMCFSHKRLWEFTFKSDNGKQPKMQRCREYASDWQEMRAENIGLLLYGCVGCGKSYAACAIANAVCEMDMSAKFVNFSEVLNDLQCNPDRNKYIQNLTEYSLLVLDDFGIERDSKYAIEQMFNIIENRMQSGKPLIVTTNLTLDEIKNPAEMEYQRIFDRLLSMCTPILFEGESMRVEKRKQNREHLAEIFSRSKIDNPS